MDVKNNPVYYHEVMIFLYDRQVQPCTQKNPREICRIDVSITCEPDKDNVTFVFALKAYRLYLNHPDKTVVASERQSEAGLYSG